MQFNQIITRQKIGVTLVLFVVILQARAYDFEDNGIFYNITAKNTVEVTCNTDTLDGYSGTVIIPKTIRFADKKYKVIRIGNFTFFRCKKLDSVIIPEGVTSIGNAAFGNSSIISVIIPTSVRSIERFSFVLCENLESIVIPDRVKRLEDATFAGCSSLVSVTIPNSISYIGNVVFFQCPKLEFITIPKNISKDGTFGSCSVFLDCENLKRIQVFWKNPPKVGAAFNQFNMSQCTLLIPKGSKSKYMNTEVWRDFGIIDEYNTQK